TPTASAIFAGVLWVVSFGAGMAPAQDSKEVRARVVELMSARRHREAQQLAEREYQAAIDRNDAIMRAVWARYLANADKMLGRLDRAEALYKDHIATFASKPSWRESIAATTVELGRLYRLQARFDEAEETMRQGLKMLEESVGPENSLVGNA